MPISFSCPACSAQINLPELGGKCPNCSRVFEAVVLSASASAADHPKSVAASLMPSAPITRKILLLAMVATAVVTVAAIYWNSGAYTVRGLGRSSVKRGDTVSVRGKITEIFSVGRLGLDPGYGKFFLEEDGVKVSSWGRIEGYRVGQMITIEGRIDDRMFFEGLDQIEFKDGRISRN